MKPQQRIKSEMPLYKRSSLKNTMIAAKETEKECIYKNLLNIIEQADSERDFVPDFKVYNDVNRAIFICADKNTLLGMVMVIQSFFQYNDRRGYSVNILVDSDVYVAVKSIMYEYFSKLNYKIKPFDNSNLEALHPFMTSSCTNNPLCRNDMNFARFFYQNYFSEPLYLYVDTDILIFANVDVFFENLGNATITVVKNLSLIYTASFTSQDACKAILSKYNIKSEHELSFNAGIYSVNNEAFVRDNHLHGLLHFMSQEPTSFKFGTQPVLNIYFFHIATSIGIKSIFCNKNHICYSDWNYTWHMAVNDTMSCFSKIKSLHFSGTLKPWNTTSPYFPLFIKVIKSLKNQH
jgi:lipopolysaccharide biosynthesis glycosyltransferase